MSSDPPTRTTETAAPPRPALQTCLAAAAVFASFLLFSVVHAPVPGPNEPHYLAKAKHFWNPGWCRGDLFLESANPHRVFYQTVGLLTRRLTLEQTAWAGRTAGYLLLAIGWTALVSRLVPGRWSSLWAAWAFLLLAAVGSASKQWSLAFGSAAAVRVQVFNLAGEWMVGGIEGKVFAYAFVLFGLAMAIDRRWNVAAASFGLAISFHPVVGLWSLAAGLFAGAVVSLRGRLIGNASGAAPAAPPRTKGGPGGVESLPVDRSPPAAPYEGGEPLPARFERMRRRAIGLVDRWALPAVLLVALAQPGLVPALAMLGDADPRTAYTADYLQVFVRLAHHLDPARIPVSAWVSYGLLFGLFLPWRRRAGLMRRDSAWLTGFVVAALLIALAGLAIGSVPRVPHPDAGPLGRPDVNSLLFTWRLKVMKLYPFRLADVMVPLAAAVVLSGLAQRWIIPRRGTQGEGEMEREGDAETDRGEIRNPLTAIRNLRTGPAIGQSVHNRTIACWAFFSGAMLVALLLPPPDRRPKSFESDRQIADWTDACRWVAENTPADALFFTRDEDWAFKWFAQRAEYVSYKDCPQDADRLVEWNRRLKEIAAWSREHFAGGYSNEAVRRLHEQTGITHIICRHRLGPFEIEPIYPTREHPNATYRVYRVRDAFEE